MSEDPRHHQLPRGTLHAKASTGKKNPKVCRMGKSLTPTLAGGGCQRYPLAYQDAKTKSGGKTDTSHGIHEAANLSPLGTLSLPQPSPPTHALVLV